MKSTYFVLLPLCACLLTACGGGSGSDAGGNRTEQSAALSVLVTDNLSTEYNEVWVKIYEVSARNEQNQEVTLFHNTQGKTINVRELAGVGSLLNMDQFPVQNYHNISVELDSNVVLVKADRSTIQARFSSQEDRFNMPVTGDFVMSSQQANSLLIDFDLSQFNYNSSTNLVSGNLVQKELGRLEHVLAEVNGVVTQVDSETQFKLRLGGQAPITVNLSQASLVSDHERNILINNTSQLQVGLNVEVKGNYDSSNKVLLARSVEVMRDNSQRRDKIEGVVAAVNGAAVELDLTQASFLPDRDHIYLSNLANAYFERGNGLQTGQKLSARGYWDGEQFVAARIEVEGGGSRLDQEVAGYAESYVELKGILNVAQQAISLRVSDVVHSNQIHINDMVNLDLSKAWYEHGMSRCMTQGVQVKVKGALQNNLFHANSVEIENGCRTTYREEYDDERSHEDSGSLQHIGQGESRDDLNDQERNENADDSSGRDESRDDQNNDRDNNDSD